MAQGFLDILTTPAVEAAQRANGSFETWSRMRHRDRNDGFTPAESAFIGERDSFYVATVAENGWPYVQHRGGPPGFLRVLGERLLGFADFSGNRQYLTLGNLAADQRSALFLMDYRNKRRLKILARAEPRALGDDPALAAQLRLPGYPARIERAMLFHLEAFDWNCPQHITARYTKADVRDLLADSQEQNRQLQEDNARLRAQLAAASPDH